MGDAHVHSLRQPISTTLHTRLNFQCLSTMVQASAIRKRSTGNIVAAEQGESPAPVVAQSSTPKTALAVIAGLAVVGCVGVVSMNQMSARSLTTGMISATGCCSYVDFGTDPTNCATDFACCDYDAGYCQDTSFTQCVTCGTNPPAPTQCCQWDLEIADPVNCVKDKACCDAGQCQDHTTDYTTCTTCTPVGAEVVQHGDLSCAHYNTVDCPGETWACCFEGPNLCQSADGLTCEECVTFPPFGSLQCVHYGDLNLPNPPSTSACCTHPDFPGFCQNAAGNACLPCSEPFSKGPSGPSGPGNNNQVAPCDDGSTGNPPFWHVHSYERLNPPGASTPGTIHRTFFEHDIVTSQTKFVFEAQDSINAYTLVITPDVNPKDLNDEFLIVYFDATGATPIVTLYVYDGNNNAGSFSGAPVIARTGDAQGVILQASSATSTNTAGATEHVLIIDTTALATASAANSVGGVNALFTFGTKIGIWLHSYGMSQPSHIGYDAQGGITNWYSGNQGWFDTSNRPTDGSCTSTSGPPTGPPTGPPSGVPGGGGLGGPIGMGGGNNVSGECAAYSPISALPNTVFFEDFDAGGDAAVLSRWVKKGVPGVGPRIVADPTGCDARGNVLHFHTRNGAGDTMGVVPFVCPSTTGCRFEFDYFGSLPHDATKSTGGFVALFKHTPTPVFGGSHVWFSATQMYTGVATDRLIPDKQPGWVSVAFDYTPSSNYAFSRIAFEDWSGSDGHVNAYFDNIRITPL
eukprot:GFYU01000063.1.p1 GENE.GFYU01000063.1~~GFYU01000063.1.p1  ORF type:complete len:745 (-),score=212.99 GFYU01000063.1:21-2255(-)